MNYLKIYNNLVLKAKVRDEPLEYVEVHHILPKCMGGDNSLENLVKLTPSEHYLAHLLLIKIYPNEPGLIYAAHIMSTSKNSSRVTNKSYSWVRTAFSKTMSERQIGKTHTEKTKKIISKNSKRMWENANTETIEHNKKRIGDLNRGKHLSEETKNKISKSRIGIKVSEETKQKLSEQRLGVSKSESHKQAISTALKGHSLSEDTKRKIGEKSRGRKMSPETKAKMLASRAKFYEERKARPLLETEVKAS